jgi:hypothetical protein
MHLYGILITKRVPMWLLPIRAMQMWSLAGAGILWWALIASHGDNINESDKANYSSLTKFLGMVHSFSTIQRFTMTTLIDCLG